MLPEPFDVQQRRRVRLPPPPYWRWYGTTTAAVTNHDDYLLPLVGASVLPIVCCIPGDVYCLPHFIVWLLFTFVLLPTPTVCILLCNIAIYLPRVAGGQRFGLWVWRRRSTRATAMGVVVVEPLPPQPPRCGRTGWDRDFCVTLPLLLPALYCILPSTPCMCLPSPCLPGVPSPIAIPSPTCLVCTYLTVLYFSWFFLHTFAFLLPFMVLYLVRHFCTSLPAKRDKTLLCIRLKT